jgi:hypothetical protein
MKTWLFSLLICCCLLGCKEAQPSASTPLNPDEMNGKRITIQGKALNSKAGAVAGDYFVDGLQSWPEDVYDKMVEVTGELKVVEHKEEDLRSPNGEWSQGMVGKQYILTKPKWRLVEPK